MNRIDFDEGELYELEKKCAVTAETLSRGESECRTLSESVTARAGELSGEITREIRRVKERLGQARALANECEERANKAAAGIRELPAMPTASFSADPERRAAEEAAFAARAEAVARERDRVARENEQLKEQERKMRRAGREAANAARILENMHRELAECLNRVSGASASFETVKARSLHGLRGAVRDMEGFNLALRRTRDVVREIGQCRDTAYNIRACGGDFGIRTDGHEARAVGATSTAAVVGEKEADGDSVLTDMGGGAVGIPAARLHALGGSGFLAEMEGKGYALKRENGSMISAGGYIVWEKKSET